MKHLLILVLAFACVQGFSQSESPEDVLVRMENERLQAIINRDTAKIASIYDDRYQGILASGHSVDKAGVLEFHLSGSPHIMISIEDVKASVFGNIGVTTGKQLNKAKSGHVIGQSKFMRIYQKNGNKWTIIKSQGTIVVQD